MSCKIRYKWFVGRIKSYERFIRKSHEEEKVLRINAMLRGSKGNLCENLMILNLMKKIRLSDRISRLPMKWPYILFNIKIHIPHTSV